MFGGYEGDEELYKVHEGVDEGEWEEQDEEEPLIPAGFADVRQDIVEGLDLGGTVALFDLHGLHHDRHCLKRRRTSERVVPSECPSE